MSDRLDSKVRKLLKLRKANDLAQQDAKQAAADLAEFEAELWSDMEDQGLKTLTLELGAPHGKVQIQRRETKFSRVLDKGALIQALSEAGIAEELTRPDVRKKQLNEYVRTLLENGSPLPPGLDFTSNKYVSVTRKRG